MAGDTPAPIFYQLKNIFHMLESLGSARIEGNHTTLADYIETRIEQQTCPVDAIREIENIEEAMNHIELAVQMATPISHVLLRELHTLVVRNLLREGDKTPGAYRSGNVKIAGASHEPPVVSRVQPLMDELLDFVNQDDAPKYDMLKVALAHHRFAWIHPFTNGNGRVVRLFTYALMLKFGFNVSSSGRVLNPTAIFCNDRDRYYQMLGAADVGSDDALEAWAHYVLRGVLDELTKVDQLTRYDYLRKNILLPALAFSRGRDNIDADEEKILRMAIDKGQFKARDVDAVLPTCTPRQRAYRLGKLIERRMVKSITPNARTYTIEFSNSTLIRGVVKMLSELGFTPPLD